jgi:predicted ribosomally synthesized peptide with SipW-like signal peptide
VSTTKKVLRTIVVLGLIGALAAVGAFSAFSSQTENPNNQITAGTVSLTDNDSGSALYNVSNAKPDTAYERCIEVSYGGSLPAEVKMYRSSGTLGTLAGHVTVKVEAGTQTTPSFPDCTGFTPAAGPALYDNLLSTFPTAWAGGLAAVPAGDADWDQNEKLVYRVTLTMDSDAGNQNQSVGMHTLRWEARNL